MRKTVLILSLVAGMVFFTHLKAQSDVTVGQAAPDFKLKDVTGAERSLSEFKGKFVVLEWFNHDCPFVVKHYQSGNMQALQKSYTQKDVVWLSINSSAEGKEGNYPAAEHAQMMESKGGVPTAILLDPDGIVGKLYAAKTTPHMYVINPEGNLIYQGAIDDKSSFDVADVAVAKNYVKAALDEAMAGNPVSEPSTKSYGCSVKYAK